MGLESTHLSAFISVGRDAIFLVLRGCQAVSKGEERGVNRGISSEECGQRTTPAAGIRSEEESR